MTRSFTPYDTLDHALRAWWLLVLLMLLGVLGGYLLNRARPPLYEAHASIAISIDFTRSGDLQDFEQDYVVGIVGDVIASSRIRESLAADFGLTPTELADRMSFDRSYYIWTIRARDPSPQRAADLANRWADQAYHDLGLALEQAMLADRFARQLDGLELCLEEACSDLDDIQAHIQSLTALEAPARIASRGIMPYTRFDWVQQATVPTRPAVFNVGQSVLSGALVGFLLGIWSVHLGLPSRLLERKRRAE
jgi:hypothetical protein